MQELTRKLIHLIFGLGIAVMLIVLDSVTATAILAGGLFFGIILVDLILRGYRLPVFLGSREICRPVRPFTGKRCTVFCDKCPCLRGPLFKASGHTGAGVAGGS